jgi:hypothetical protein
MPRPGLLFLVAVVCLVAASVACTSSSDSTPVAPTPASATAATGEALLPSVADFVARVEASDVEAVAQLAELHDRACKPEASPPCDPGDPPGTTYPAFAAAACEGYWARDVQGLMESAVEAAGPLYAVAELGPTPQWAIEAGWPYGDTVVVFEGTSGRGIPRAVGFYLDTTTERLVRVQVGCRRADQFLEPGVDESPMHVIWQAP